MVPPRVRGGGPGAKRRAGGEVAGRADLPLRRIATLATPPRTRGGLGDVGGAVDPTGNHQR